MGSANPTHSPKEIRLGPDDTVYWLAGRRADSADRKRLGSGLGHTVEAFRLVLSSSVSFPPQAFCSSLHTLIMGVTWPRYPAVPDSMSGTPPAWQRRLTCRRASGMSRCPTCTLSPPHFHHRHLIRSRKRRTHIIQRIHHQPEPLDPLDIIHALLDVTVPCVDLDS